VVNDQAGSPTYAADLAEVIVQIIVNWIPGIYHFSNDGIITWYDFAREIKKITGSTCTIKPISFAEYPDAAKRPAYSVLDKSKIQKTFNIKLKDWKTSLQSCIKKCKC
jgi:dTDP-4-dehydrorhamnose reductase